MFSLATEAPTIDCSPTKNELQQHFIIINPVVDVPV